ncbi:MAG: signal peptidase I [Phycisphaeraceae bacterium]|nr:signal peptidase I [Phycisphaeraceae bacterium]
MPDRQPSRASKPKPRHAEESLKDTFESIVVAFILAFVFRAYVVEAFVIPTGSMAPTLLGRHMEVVCEQCGHRFAIDAPHEDGGPPASHLKYDAEAICPMCHFVNRLPSRSWVRPGDRILVHKYIYSLSEPRRWDVVVFKYPDEPSENFIKRLIGLPGEQLWIIDGNVYTQSLDAGEQPWVIARKSDRPQVQRAVWQPVFHSACTPLDEGRISAGRVDHRDREHPWRLPWIPVDPARWTIDRRQGFAHETADEGGLTFDFAAAETGQGTSTFGPNGWYPYNQFRSLREEPIEDVRVALTVKPLAPGLTLKISTSNRVDDPDPYAVARPLTATLEPDGTITIATPGANGLPRLLAESHASPLTPHRAHRVEFWFVDQEASVWIDGTRLCAWRFELPIETLEHRPPPASRPTIQLDVAGAPVTLHNLDVDRDIYYSSAIASLDDNLQPGLGTLVKVNGRVMGDPIRIGPDRFFCLGDNSPMSKDSRFWISVNPWIRSRMFNPGEQTHGLVPRELMIGKAFFVYFPAPWNYSGKATGIIPNFGDMRFIH